MRISRLYPIKCKVKKDMKKFDKITLRLLLNNLNSQIHYLNEHIKVLEEIKKEVLREYENIENIFK